MGTNVPKNATWKFNQAVFRNSTEKEDIEQAKKGFRNTHFLKECDEYTEYCLCGSPLKRAFIFKNIYTHRLVTVGESCMKKFGITYHPRLYQKVKDKEDYESNPDKEHKDMSNLTDNTWSMLSKLNLAFIKDYFTRMFKTFEEECNTIHDVEKYEKHVKIWILDYPEEFAEFADRIRNLKDLLLEKERLRMVRLHEYQLENEARLEKERIQREKVIAQERQERQEQQERQELQERQDEEELRRLHKLRLENERVERVKKEELIKAQEVERSKRIQKERKEKLFHITVDETFNDKYKEYTADGINTAIAYCALMDIDEMLQIKDHLELPDCMLSIVIAGDFPLLMFKSQTSNETYYMLNLITLKQIGRASCRERV